MTIVDRFVDYTSADPEAPAVVSGKKTLTRRDLDRRSNQFANLLKDHGVGVDNRVSLRFSNVPAFVVAVLGAMKRGAVPFPINTRFKGEEVQSVLKAGEARVHVQADRFADTLPCVANIPSVEAVFSSGGSSPMDNVREFEAVLEEYPTTYDHVDRDPDDVADLMFTSGTTGRPKGVVHSHRNATAVVAGLASQFDLNAEDRLLVLSPAFHVSGGKLMLASFALGAPMVLLNDWSVEEFLETVERHRVTFAHLITTVAVEVSKFDTDLLDRYNTDSLQAALIGGGSTTDAVFDVFEEHIGGVLCEGYGLTETEGCATFNPPDDRRRVGSNGLPHPAWCDVRVVDPETREPRDPGESGEILVAGDVVTPRYFERPDLTASAFVALPGNDVGDDGDGSTQDRWLATGDLGFQDEDGYLYFRGRLDDRMKTGGENVYPAEVESVLLELEGVADAAVVGVPDERWGERICAAVVRADPSLAAATLEGHCRESDVLANYKRPREVAFVEAVPKLENRKIDRRAVVDLF